MLQPDPQGLLAARVAAHLGAEHGLSLEAAAWPRALSAASAGATNSENVTTAETGLPGSPNTSFGTDRVPNQVGLPGCSATLQNTSSTPSSASAGLT